MNCHELPRSIGLQGVRNARELGGIHTRDGRCVKPGLLLRTGALAGATGEDRQRLTDALRLQWVADFRTVDESTAQPDPVLPGVTQYHLLVLDEDQVDPSLGQAIASFHKQDGGSAILDVIRAGQFRPAIYRDVLLTPWGLEAYRAFFQLLLKGDGEHSLLFHCTAGKDRTGIAAALLLTALGVDFETVLEDYELTNLYLSGLLEASLEEARKNGAEEEVLTCLKAFWGVDRAFLSGLFDAICEEYTSVEAFLAGPMDLNSEKQARLKDLYLI